MPMPRSRPARQHAGAVPVKSHNYPQRGRQAVLADPDGAGWLGARLPGRSSARRAIASAFYD